MLSRLNSENYQNGLIKVHYNPITFLLRLEFS